jgi:hypothetical protein
MANQRFDQPFIDLSESVQNEWFIVHLGHPSLLANDSSFALTALPNSVSADLPIMPPATILSFDFPKYHIPFITCS